MWKQLSKLREEYLNLGIRNTTDYEKFSMISIIYHSTKIEGCSLTETDTRILIEEDITAGGKPLRDHLMIKDHYNAFLFVREEAEKRRKFTPDFIKAVNALVMRHTGGIAKTVMGIFDTSAGDLRLAQVYAGRKYFPDFKKVPGLLETLCRSVNERIDNVKKNNVLKLAADLHYNLVNIHPFGDGNGRTSRLMMNYIQLYHNEPLVKIFTEDRAKYIDALNETEDREDPEIFRNFICGQQIKFYKAEIKKYKKLAKNFCLLF
jgi:Fic family protein